MNKYIYNLTKNYTILNKIKYIRFIQYNIINNEDDCNNIYFNNANINFNNSNLQNLRLKTNKFCNICKGKGWITKTNLKSTSGQISYDICINCKGTGLL